MTNENAVFRSVWVLSIFACFFALISVTSLVQKSPTYDEPLHLFAGYSYLKWGNYRANPAHPPLAKVWAALPLLAIDIKDPRPGNTHWELITEEATPTPASACFFSPSFRWCSWAFC